MQEPVPPAHFLLHGSAKKTISNYRSSFICLLGIDNAMHCGYVYTKESGHIRTEDFFLMTALFWGHPADFPHATYKYTLQVHKAGSLELSLSIVALNLIIDVGSDPTHSKAHHEDADQSDGSSNSMAAQVQRR